MNKLIIEKTIACFILVIQVVLHGMAILYLNTGAKEDQYGRRTSSGYSLLLRFIGTVYLISSSILFLIYFVETLQKDKAL